MFQKPKGTVDILPKETVIWHKMEEVIRTSAANAGFNEIRIPTFELSGVYRRGVGNTTDIVQKEMFTLTDKGDGTEMCLRPEGTAGVVRSVIENGLFNEAMPPQKLFAFAIILIGLTMVKNGTARTGSE